MKRSLMLAVALAGLAMNGCKTNAPLPPGAVYAPEAQLNEDLQAVKASLDQWKADVAAGKHVPSQEEKNIVNVVVDAYNVAAPLEIQWHAALNANPLAAQPAALAAAQARLKAALANAATLLPPAKVK